MKKYKIIVAGGGTAGHIFPIISVISELKKIRSGDLDVLYLGDILGSDKNIVQKFGIKFKGIYTGKWRRYFSWSNLLVPLQTFLGIIMSLWYFFKFKPDVVFTKGGYVSVVVGLVAKLLCKPLVIHESDAVMGVANKILSRWAKKIAVAYPKDYYPSKYTKKLVYTGNPIREEFYSINKEKARKTLRIGQDENLILVMGGSQGAHFINNLIFESLNLLLEKNIVIHITGQRDYLWAQNLKNKLSRSISGKYLIFDFVSRGMAQLMKGADIVISRAGANTLAELSYLGKTSILIPLSSSANAHQQANAKIFRKNRAAIVLGEPILTSPRLVYQIIKLQENKKLAKELSENMKAFAQKDASRMIAKIIEDILKKKGK